MGVISFTQKTTMCADCPVKMKVVINKKRSKYGANKIDEYLPFILDGIDPNVFLISRLKKVRRFCFYLTISIATNKGSFK